MRSASLNDQRAVRSSKSRGSISRDEEALLSRQLKARDNRIRNIGIVVGTLVLVVIVIIIALVATSGTNG